MTTFQSLQTWIGHNATRYHNLNTLPHALQYILSEIYPVLSYKQQVTTCYRHFFKKNINVHFFIQFDSNAVQIAPNHAKLRENAW